jgi:hypothetical protein
LEQSTIHRGYNLQNQLLSVMALEWYMAITLKKMKQLLLS